MDYWIDEEISTYTCKEQHEDIAPFISAIYNDIKWSTGSKDQICAGKKKVYSSGVRKLGKELDDFCEIRDNFRCNILKDMSEYLKYPNYINKKKQYFLTEKQDKCDSDGCNIND